MITLLLAMLLSTDPMVTNTLDIPQQYQQGNTSVLVTVNTQATIDRRCGKAPAGYVTMACEDGDTGVLYMPNPCLVAEYKDPESYAHLLCHEIAHKEGWHHVNE